jgi:hypothetical protein
MVLAEKCSLCGGEKIPIGRKLKVKLDPMLICPTCDPNLVSIAQRRRKLQEPEPDPEDEE